MLTNTDRFLIFLFVSLCLSLSSCQFTPPCCDMKSVPERALELAQQQALNSSAYVPSDWMDEDWWYLFGDEQLSNLIGLALANNPTIAKAEIRVRSALALRDQAIAPLFPTLDAEGDITRIRNSKNGLVGYLSGFELPNGKSVPISYTQPEASLSFNYEFDFWRKHQNQIKATVDEANAREAERYQSNLIISISVARAYFEFQGAKEREKLARHLVENNDRLLGLQKDLHQQRLSTDLAMISSKTNFLNARQYLIQISQDVSTSSHELQALIADNFGIPVLDKELSLGCSQPFPLPCSIPMDVLAHRPDIWAQSWRVEAAARLVNVAKADFYPNVNLAAFIGLQTITAANFFSRDSLYWAYGPAFHLPIFRGGYIQAKYDASMEDFNLAVAEYDSLVLDAVKEVLNALDAVRLTMDFYEQARSLEREAKRGYELVTMRLKQRLNNRSEIITYENAWIEAQDASIQALLMTLNARLALIRALGGMQKIEM